MSSQGLRVGSILSALVAFLILGGGLTAQTAPAAPQRPGEGKRAAPRRDDWPKKVKFGDNNIFLDAPQAESLEGNKLKARGNMRVQVEGENVSLYGTAWYEADVGIDRDKRTVMLISVEVPKVQLTGATPARQQRLASRLGLAVTRMQWTLPLDDVLAGVKIAARREEVAPKLNTDPPKILFETEPAILVIFDGEPRFRAVEGFKLERALNTPFLVLREPSGNAYYLNGGTTWFHASSPNGPWTKADKVPSDATQIASRDLKDAGVATSEVEQAKQTADNRVPKIVIATEPTELIVSDGAPQWKPAVEGELESLANSETDVFRTLPDQQYYLVLSGRWYRSESWSGPWSYVEPDRLPGSFRKIPSDSPKADALTFVPGTGPAHEAVADASKPRTAAVRRKDAHVNVTYDGEPRFEAVPGTHVEYALNTPDQVLRIRDRYYVCDQGVWFTAGAPTGPWVVADSIPDEEIRAIPPASPVYNTRYVYVYDSTPDVVYMAYTPAYLGSYRYYGTVVFGTGWFYRPWWGAFYYPRPWTWGFHALYAPWAGWGWGFGWGPAWAGFRFGFGYGWGAAWCGPGAFFRPAYLNVNITRNVNVTRSVNVTRNLYASGANATRTVTRTAPTMRTVAAGRQAQAQTAGKSSPKAQTALTSPSGQARRGGKGKGAGGGKPSGKASGGGKKH